MSKVLLTVSPSHPFLLPQPHVSPKEPRRLPSLSTTHYPPTTFLVSLATRHSPLATSPLFSSTCRLFASLCSLFRARFLCFQQVAASFAKMPGVGYPNAFSASAFAPSASLRYPLLKGSHRGHCSTSSFRINTCKTVSKQTTLTPFRINTCEKTRGGRGLV